MNYDALEELLLYGLKVTMVKQGVELTSDNYKYAMFNSLCNIILSNDYINFTSNNDVRNTIKKFSRYDCAKLVVRRILDAGVNVSRDDAGRINMSISELRRVIGYYVTNCLSIPSKYFDGSDVVIQKKDDYEVKNVSFHSPINSCREAVLSDNQTKVKCSEEKIAGMQSYSSVGKVRHNQEDSYYVGVHPSNPNFKIMLVADGMGGRSAGEVASNIATKEMLLWFESLSKYEFFEDDTERLSEMLDRKLGEIDNKIKNATRSGGTTLCFSIIRNNSIVMGNIGDSKGLVFEDGNLAYVTKSDGYITMDKDVDELNVDYFSRVKFSRFHPANNLITCALGQFEDEVTYRNVARLESVTLEEGKDYQVVLCSDGVSDCLSDNEIISVVSNNKDGNIAKNLVDAALNNRSSFKSELEKCKAVGGVIGRSSYNKLLKILDRYHINEESIIYGGKDNTTAVSTSFKR